MPGEKLVRTVAGKRISNQLRHSTFKICNLEVEKIAGQMGDRSSTSLMVLQHPTMPGYGQMQQWGSQIIEKSTSSP